METPDNLSAMSPSMISPHQYSAGDMQQLQQLQQMHRMQKAGEYPSTHVPYDTPSGMTDAIFNIINDGHGMNRPSDPLIGNINQRRHGYGTDNGNAMVHSRRRESSSALLSSTGDILSESGGTGFHHEPVKRSSGTADGARLSLSASTGNLSLAEKNIADSFSLGWVPRSSGAIDSPLTQRKNILKKRLDKKRTTGSKDSVPIIPRSHSTGDSLASYNFNN
jgi:hypothetical protein